MWLGRGWAHQGCGGRPQGGSQDREKAFLGVAPPRYFFPLGSRDQTSEYFWLFALTPVRDHGIWAAYGPLGSL